MKLSVKTLALVSARHPWRTIFAWVVLVVVAVLAIGALLGGALTTEGNPTNNPESQRAAKTISDSFPAATGAEITDIIILRSTTYTIDEPEFQALVRELASDVRATGVAPVRTYLDTDDPSLVTEDRHA